MPENIDKLGRFSEAIDAECSAATEELIGKAKKQAEEALKKADEEYKRESERFAAEGISRVRSETARSVSQKSFASGREVIVHRNKLVDELFEEIRLEVLNYTETAAYKEKLGAMIKELQKDFPFYEGVTLYVKENDLETAEELVKGCGVTVKADGNIRLGGVTAVYPKENRCVDKTLDDAFRTHKEGFVNKSEMQLER